MKCTPIQLAEYRQREFHTDEVWLKWKREFDALMGFRKTLKGKPTPEQMYILEENAWTIKFLKRFLFGADLIDPKSKNEKLLHIFDRMDEPKHLVLR